MFIKLRRPLISRITSPAVLSGTAQLGIFRGQDATNASGSTHTFNVDIGAAAADRLIIVAAVSQNPHAVPVVTANAVILTADKTDNSTFAMGIWSGVVASGSGVQSVVVNWVGAAFEARSMYVWRLTGLNSNLVKTTGFNTITTAVGDFLFGLVRGNGGPTNFAGSSETPARFSTVDTASSSADWIVATTAGTFTIAVPGYSGSITLSATYK